MKHFDTCQSAISERITHLQKQEFGEDYCQPKESGNQSGSDVDNDGAQQFEQAVTS
jgi:hypothetical protein